MAKSYEIHVRVADFEYIQCNLEGEAKDAWEEYMAIANTIKFGNGLSEDDFRKIYDLVAQGNSINGDPGILDGCNGFQRFAINEAKKFLKRKAGIKNTMNNHTTT